MASQRFVVFKSTGNGDEATAAASLTRLQYVLVKAQEKES